ncbi:transposase [Mesonia aestuariivivens]|uniref:transposase n=1 Tax=Mesonia aestuariivivens TaxID=2796128 RepID=UPI002107C6C5|nr:transposase [Mesonia aestuariivivens]
MQGKKVYQEQLFNSFRLSDRVPPTNFYRRLKEALNLDFLYDLTRGFYGSSGQKSIDPVVFFKLCLVGYLENIISDRKLIEHCRKRLDILYFIDYDIDEELPWHSTISRTRQLFPEDIFEAVFTKVFTLCVDAGMVSGHTQAIDSAPVKANASMDTLELKVPEEELESHLRRVRHISAMDKEQPFRKSKGDKSDKGQRSITANEQELQAISSRNKRWSKDQDQRPGSGNKGSKYTSNSAFLSLRSSEALQSYQSRCPYQCQARVESPQGRYMKGKRQSTVEPVFGTLTQFMGLRKVNTLGLKQANKCMQLSAIAYNLKKYLKFIEKRTKSGAGMLGMFLKFTMTLNQEYKFILKRLYSANLQTI